MRVLGLFLFLAVIAAAAFVYDVKYRTSRLAHDEARIEQQISQEKAAIGALRAEWSALNQPARLQTLVGRHLPGFQNLGVSQMAFAYELPDRPLDLGTFITNLDSQPGLETPIDKKDVPPPLLRKTPTLAKIKPTRPMVSNVSAQPLKLIPIDNH